MFSLLAKKLNVKLQVLKIKEDILSKVNKIKNEY
jgi:hypothetical protein